MTTMMGLTKSIFLGLFFFFVWLSQISTFAHGIKPFRPHQRAPGRRPPGFRLPNGTNSKGWLIDRGTPSSSFSLLDEIETPVASALTSAMVAKGLFDLWPRYFGRAQQHPQPRRYQYPTTATRRMGSTVWKYFKLMVLYAISHTDLIHLLVNLFFAYTYGHRLEQRYGSGRMLVLVGAVVVGGGLINLAGWRRFTQYQGRGSSGISLALLSAYAFGDVLHRHAHGGRHVNRAFKANTRSPRRSADAMGLFLAACCGVLELQLMMLDQNLSVRLHTYGLVVGALFAYFIDRSE